MHRLFLITAAIGAAALADAAAAQRAAQPLECGGTYRIARGDTLQRLAVRAYGPDASYAILWRHNRERLGLRNPSLIEVGQEIEIPCLDADGAPIVAETLVPDLEAASAEGGDEAINAAEPPAVSDDPGRPVATARSAEADASEQDDAAGSPFPPDGERRASAPPPEPTTAPEPEPQLALIVAEGAELGAALAAEAMASSPEAPEFPPLMVALAPAGGCVGLNDCAGLAWSEPIVQTLAVVHTRRDRAWLTGLDGLRVCRAGDLPPSLAEGAAAVVERAAAVDCLRLVAIGEADAALSPAAAADIALGDRLLAATLTEQHAMARLIDVRAAADPEDPRA
ncbi:MAG: LysM peptidoglycan-binding domain-containing protein, partial [Rubrimonas sp.]